MLERIPVCPLILSMLASVALLLACSSDCMGQGGQGPGGGGQPPVVPPGTQVPPVDQGTPPQIDDGANQNPVGGGGGGGDTGDGELETVDPFQQTFDIPDRRNQGFVGSTAERISAQGFVGAPSQNGGPELDPDAVNASPGGNVNNGLGQRTATTTTVQLQQNGFTVQRNSIRTRLVASFAAPRTPAFVAQSRFQSRIARQPVVNRLGQNVSISVANRTAIMTGTVNSDSERNIIKRQLRLEPGIYRIDDQTRIVQ